MTLVVHPHFHHRRSGATTHVEDMVRALQGAFSTAAIGRALSPGLPRMGLGALLRRARTEPVIWHAHRNLELLAGLLLRAVAPDLRVVFTRHAGAPPGRYTRALAARADRVVALTSESAESLRLPASVIGHGVDLARFPPPTDRAAAWRALGLPGTRGVGVVGRIRPDKGQGDLVEAIGPLLPAHPEWHVALVGLATPKFRAFATGLAEKLGDRGSLPGQQQEVVRWYQGLSVLVHPSYSEGYSLVLLEAMAAGCCVVASRLPYTDGLVAPGRTGFLFEPGDVAGLRRILEELLDHPQRAEEVGRAAAAEARARLGLEVEAKRLGELYEAVLAHRPRLP